MTHHSHAWLQHEVFRSIRDIIWQKKSNTRNHSLQPLNLITQPKLCRGQKLPLTCQMMQFNACNAASELTQRAQCNCHHYHETF